MPSVPPVRKFSTKAHRLDERKQDGHFLPVQEFPYPVTYVANSQSHRQDNPPTAPYAVLQMAAEAQLHRQYSLPPASMASRGTFTSPPQYKEPPANLRPHYYGDGKDMKTPPSTLDHDHHPPPETASTEDLCSHHATARRTPFWRTKKGIIIIVLLSNIVILGAVLGGVLASRRSRHWHPHSKLDKNNAAGDNSEGSSSSVEQPGAGPPAASSVHSAAPSLPLPSAGLVSTTSLSTAATPASHPSGTSNTDGIDDGVDPVKGQFAGLRATRTTQTTNGPLVEGQSKA